MIPPELVPRQGRAVLLVDGGSGAGKSTLAQRIADGWPGPITVVSLDDFFPGWDGLDAASRLVAESVLRPRDPGYRRWDWRAGRPAEWVALDPEASLLIEGCGALTQTNRALATAGIWVAANPAERRRRALARDGEAFEGHWEQWAAQEHTHWRKHRPRDLADWWVVDGRFHRHAGRPTAR